MQGLKNDAKALKSLLLKERTATMEKLKSVLDTTVNMTVFRKLKKLSYIQVSRFAAKIYIIVIVYFVLMKYGHQHYYRFLFSQLNREVECICNLLLSTPQNANRLI